MHLKLSPRKPFETPPTQSLRSSPFLLASTTRLYVNTNPHCLFVKLRGEERLPEATRSARHKQLG